MYSGLHKKIGGFYISHYKPSGADKVSGEVMAACHCYAEGDGLTLCEWHARGYNCTHSCCGSFTFAGTDRFLFLNFFGWILLHNLIDMIFQNYHIDKFL